MYSQIRNISIASIAVIALGGVFQTACADTEANKALVLRLLEVHNQGNLAVADEILATDFVNHDPSRPDVTDLESYRGWVVENHTAFPDFHVEVHGMLAEGDEVAARWTVTGTQQGEFMGIPPTGRQITVTGMHIHRLVDAKIVEAWWAYDALGMVQQLTDPLPVPDELVKDQITSPALEGNLLGDPAVRNMLIYLPPGYESSEQAYPVVYLLLALVENHRSWPPSPPGRSGP